jgi:hypothetical protein
VDESRRIRLQKLVRGIGDLLDRGATPDEIRAELIRRAMPHATATDLVARVVEARARASNPTPNPTLTTAPVNTLSTHAQRTPAAPGARSGTLSSLTTQWARMIISHWTTPNPASAFLAVATIALVLIGSGRLIAGVRDSGGREYEDIAARLEAEIDAARADIHRFEEELTTRTHEADTITALRARIARGPRAYASPNAYRAAVARYKRYVTAWNQSLPQYRQLGEVYMATVALHNLKLDSLGAASRKLEPRLPEAHNLSDKRVRFSSVVPEM